MTVRSHGCLIAAPLALLLATAGTPVRAEPEEADTVDDALMESLNAGSLDEFDRELFGPRSPKPDLPADRPDDRPADRPGQKEDPKNPPSEKLEERLLTELGAAAVEEIDPLLSIARQMRKAQSLIDENELGPKTQAVQTRIVANLEALIEQARRQCQESRPSESQPRQASRKPVTQPKKKPEKAKKKPGEGQGKPSDERATDSDTQPAESAPKRPDMAEMRALIKDVWGDLPEREREEMLEWLGEEFLPKYEVLIELYFRRLAESPDDEEG